eukprot:scaffold14851_cov57-Phaeocystis_antarctica.AAC.1
MYPPTSWTLAPPVFPGKCCSPFSRRPARGAEDAMTAIAGTSLPPSTPSPSPNTSTSVSHPSCVSLRTRLASVVRSGVHVRPRDPQPGAAAQRVGPKHRGRPGGRAQPAQSRQSGQLAHVRAALVPEARRSTAVAAAAAARLVLRGRECERRGRGGARELHRALRAADSEHVAARRRLPHL